MLRKYILVISLLIVHLCLFILHIEHFTFCPKWKSVTVGDEVGVFSFYFQIFFDVTISDNEYGAGYREVFCFF